MAAASALAMLFAANVSRADIPPPGRCTTLDAVCHEAGPNYDQEGICRAKRCTRATPTGTMEFDCMMCTSAGGAGGSSTGGAGAGGSAPGTGGTTSSDKDDGCSLSASSPSAEAGALAALGALVASVARRRRR